MLSSFLNSPLNPLIRCVAAQRVGDYATLEKPPSGGFGGLDSGRKYLKKEKYKICQSLTVKLRDILSRTSFRTAPNMISL